MNYPHCSNFNNELLLLTVQKNKRIEYLQPLFAAMITFLTYATVYGFRKPFAAVTYDDIAPVWGITYKTCLVISQLLGYMLSKFFGIRFIAELKKIGRGKTILVLVGISWIALLLFAIIPPPYNIPFLFINGFPLGLIWGIIFSFVEGRKATDFIGAALAVSFIFSSGFVKSIAAFIQTKWPIPDLWVPFVSGLFFLPMLLLFIWLLEKIPPPGETDKQWRTEREPMPKEKRKAFIQQFLPGLITLISIYVFLTVFRDIRDNFAADMWKDMGYTDLSEKLLQTEIPVTIFILLLIGAMIFIRHNFKALVVAHIIVIAGFLTAGISSYLFAQQLLSPFNWMMLVGLGLYAGYIPFNCVFFERLIAAFKCTGNVGFIMYLADAYGYLGSMLVTVSKSVFRMQLNWTSFYSHGVILFSMAGIAGTVISLIYFLRKYQKQYYTQRSATSNKSLLAIE